MEWNLTMLLSVLVSGIIFALIRIVFISQFKENRRIKNARTLIVIGSGGHTHEMLKQVRTLDPKLYIPRLYVMSDSDKNSEPKIRELEEQFTNYNQSNYDIVKIPRGRSVNQSYLTSVFTTAYSIVKSAPVVFKFKPNLILCNGPGTCIPSWLTSKSMPLKGIKVLELAGLAPAPFCCSILADFGASVIKIDRVSVGYETDCLNNGKKSIAIDLKDERGKKIFLKLSSRADVLVEPFRKGVMEKLGLGPEPLTKLNPRLIYARLTGFGQSGPLSSMAGHDINFLSLSGLLSLFGRKGEKPTPPVNLAADFAGGGLTCAFGILLALFERSKSGKGQIIDSSMVEGAAYVGSWFFRSRNLPIWGRERGENVLDSGYHFYDTYETKDGKFVAVGALEPQFYSVLVDKLKSPELEDQWSDVDEKKRILADIFKRKTREEWCEIFDGADACVTPVLEITEAADHIHNKTRETFLMTDSGLVAPKPAPVLSRTQGISKANLPGVETGKHTEEILIDLGYSKRDIEDLISNGVVKVVKNSKL